MGSPRARRDPLSSSTARAGLSDDVIRLWSRATVQSRNAALRSAILILRRRDYLFASIARIYLPLARGEFLKSLGAVLLYPAAHATRPMAQLCRASRGG